MSWRLSLPGSSQRCLGGPQLSHFIHRRLKGRNPDLSRFLRLRLRLYLIPLIFSLAVGDPVPFLATLSGMIGVEIITNYYHYVKGVA